MFVRIRYNSAQVNTRYKVKVRLPPCWQLYTSRLVSIGVNQILAISRLTHQFCINPYILTIPIPQVPKNRGLSLVMFKKGSSRRRHHYKYLPTKFNAVETYSFKHPDNPDAVWKPDQEMTNDIMSIKSVYALFHRAYLSTKILIKAPPR